MLNGQSIRTALALLPAAAVLLAACRRTPVNVETPVASAVVSQAATEVVVTPTLAPEVIVDPVQERTLVICLGQEPDSLYPYGSSMLAQDQVLAAVYDGPIDNRSFDYQAIILEKLPSLADGDAVLQAVDVAPGELIVDNDADITSLLPGVVYRPSGCQTADCAETYAEGDGNVTLDQMVVTFVMLPGLVWSDGAPLTAADSVYSFELASSPETPVGKFAIERTAAYEALDDITIQWSGLPGYIDSTYYLNFYSPLPQHVWGQYTAAELLEIEASARMPLGWGPYVIEEWITGDSISLERNENYFRAEEGLPRFDHAVYRFVGQNSNAKIAMILSGECDLVDQTSGLDDQSELLLELQAAGQLTASFATGTTFEHADFGILPLCYDQGSWAACLNEGRPDFFGDVRTRRAFTMCMDRQAVVDTVLFGQSVVLDSYLPRQHPLFNSDIATYPYDPAAAGALLEEAGWTLAGSADGIRVYAGDNPNIPVGARLSVNYSTTSGGQRQQVALVLAASMLTCGIETTLEFWMSSEFYAEGPDGPLFGRRFDIGQFAWLTGVQPPCDLWLSEAIPGEDPDVYPYAWGGWNNPGYSNPSFDGVCKAALASLPGQPGYEENHLRAQAIFAEDLPVAPLYLRLKLAAMRPDLCGYIEDATEDGDFWNIEEFDYGGC